MSDEQREQGRDASAPTDRPRTEQPPVPSYTAATAPVGGAPAGGNPPGGNPAGNPGGHGPAYPGPAQSGPSWSSGPPHYGTNPYSQTAVNPLPGPTTEKPRKQRAMGGIVAAALIAGIVGGGAGFGGAYALLGSPSGGTQLTSSPSSTNASALTPGSVPAAAAKMTPSTVDIQGKVAQGTVEGTGVILTADGNVLTNNHVVAGTQGPVTVTLADGTTHTATIVGTSPSYDLAVLKIQNVSGLTPATLGRSADLQVGQTVVAIGSPKGLTGTVTSGIVSAFNRTVSTQGEDGSAIVYNGLQTDAAINPGNSGGPLINLDGQVVGIDSAIATGGGQSDGSIGLGFAIPIDQAKRIAQEIMSTGTASKPVLGVQGNAAGSGTGGAQIGQVVAGSPAAAAGLAAGDVVTKVGDATVQNFADLIARIGSYAPGQQVTLTLTNGGATRTAQVTLGSQPDKAASTSTGGESTSPFGRSPFGGGNGGGNGGTGGGNGEGGNGSPFGGN
ncbi:S1C family serine protease [Pseudonocardia sp. GCM10023141]|uniref:S1C family serine protease n=1 Tax=Pseudonocardia sp. GCM10023141 TaxID=3252653 RepID=UPI00361B78A3